MHIIAAFMSWQTHHFSGRRGRLSIYWKGKSHVAVIVLTDCLGTPFETLK